MQHTSREPKEFDEKVIRISRVSKKTKGGNKIGFTALVVIGDRKGRVGVALGKAGDVLSAIKKGVRKSKKNLVNIPLVDGRTIAHAIDIKFGAAHLIMKPAPLGTGVIAGGSVRAVLELAGVRDVVAKTLGTNNKLTNVTATFNALKSIKNMVDKKTALGQNTGHFHKKPSVLPEALPAAPKKLDKPTAPQTKKPLKSKSKKTTKGK
ncbi:MAG: Ribosomal protein S5 [Microgenomates group bacterium GW2011_GWF2_47_9]|nr:MAG: Ribosomal protein S5 [Microgenomates group bacterium GW2011_GWF2_47_9]